MPATATKTNTFEGGTNGNAVTNVNSGGGSGDTLTQVYANGTGASVVYDNTKPAHGSLGAKLTPVSGATCYIQYGDGTNPISTSNPVMQATLEWSAITSGGNCAWLFISTAGGGTRLASIHTDSTGKFYLRGTGATVLWTSTNAMPLNQKVRLDFRAAIATSTTGELHFAYYLGDSATPVESVDLTAVDMGTTAANAFTAGKQSGTDYATAFYVDDFKVGTDGNNGFLPRYSVAAAATVRPAAVTNNGGAWVTDSGAAPTGAALADELDTTYVTNPGTAATEAITYSLNPLTAGPITLHVRCYKPSGTAANLKVELLEGTTVRASRVLDSTTTTATYDSGTGIADYTLDLTSGENTAVTDRTSLAVRLTANGS